MVVHRRIECQSPEELPVLVDDMDVQVAHQQQDSLALVPSADSDVVELGPVLAVLVEATLPVPLDEVLSVPLLPCVVPDPEESVAGLAQMQLPNRRLVLSNSH